MAAADILMPRPSGPGQWLDTWQCGPLGAGLIAAVLRWAPEPSEIVASTLCPVLLRRWIRPLLLEVRSLDLQPLSPGSWRATRLLEHPSDLLNLISSDLLNLNLRGWDPGIQALSCLLKGEKPLKGLLESHIQVPSGACAPRTGGGRCSGNTRTGQQRGRETGCMSKALWGPFGGLVWGEKGCTWPMV